MPTRHRVQDEVNALLGTLVLDAVALKAVEKAQHSPRHVHGCVAASEKHVGVRDHGNVQPEVRPPIVMDVDVRRDVRARGEPHQPASSPDAADLRHDLLNIGTEAELLRRAHWAAELIRRARPRE